MHECKVVRAVLSYMRQMHVWHVAYTCICMCRIHIHMPTWHYMAYTCICRHWSVAYCMCCDKRMNMCRWCSWTCVADVHSLVATWTSVAAHTYTHRRILHVGTGEWRHAWIMVYSRQAHMFVCLLVCLHMHMHMRTLLHACLVTQIMYACVRRRTRTHSYTHTYAQ